MLRVLDLFSGIGGFSLGLERTGGFSTVAFCEIDPYCRAVLRKHWPDVPCFSDVRDLHAWDVGPVDVICGGFPCQDISLAGRGEGLGGTRSGLWSEYRRIIEECRPAWVIIENVSALRSRGLDKVLGELYAIGYDAEWHCIPASAVGAPHQRDRIWIVGYPARATCERHASEIPREEAKECSQGQQHGDLPIGSSAPSSRLGNAHHPRLQGLGELLERARERSAWSDGEVLVGADGKPRLVKPGLPLLANGVPSQVQRIRTTGNAVVPKIPEIIGRAILAAESIA